MDRKTGSAASNVPQPGKRAELLRRYGCGPVPLAGTVNPPRDETVNTFVPSTEKAIPMPSNGTAQTLWGYVQMYV